MALGTARLALHGPFELAGLAAAHATRVLGRPVTIDGLTVKLGSPVTVALRGLVIGNLPGAGPTPFLTLGTLDAEIAPGSLVGWAFFGRGPTLQRLALADVAASLDHAPDGQPNWHLGAAPRDPRPGFPTLFDAAADRVAVDIHTSSGKLLQIRVDRATLAAKAADQPMALAASGSYDGFPVTLAGALQSFDRLHQTGTPFGAEVHLASGDARVDFTGTLTRPLAADGVAGRLRVAAPSPDRLLAIVGVGGHAAMPLTLEGDVARDNDVWRLTDAKGTLDGQPAHLTGSLHEGPRHAPDAFTVDAGFGVVDLAKIGGQDKAGETLLRIDDAPGTLLDGHITAQRMTDGDLAGDDVDIQAKLAPGAFSLAPLAMRFAGGTVRLDVAIKNGAGQAATVRVDGSLGGADPVALARLLGLGDLPITGPVDLRFGLDGTAVKASDAGRNAEGGLVLAMQGGTVARSLLEMASTDMRALFRDADGVGRISCLLGVLDLKAGLGRMAPLRLKTSAGTLIGEGTLDLRRDTIDVTFATEAATTSLFALDVPVRLAGPLHDPHVMPSTSRPNAGGNLDGLAPSLRDFARANPCATR